MPITPVSVNSAASGSGIEISGGASQDTSGATLLVAVVSTYRAVGATYGGMTDSLGNTWRTATGFGGLSYGCRISYSYDHGGSALSTGAGHTFGTTNNGSVSFPAIVVYSFVGTDTTSAVFVVPDTGTANSSTGTYAPGPITPAVGDLLVSGMVDNVSGSLTIGSSFSAVTTTGPVGGGSVRVGAAYLIVSSAVSTNPQWNSSTDEHEVVMARFLVGAGATDTLFAQAIF